MKVIIGPYQSYVSPYQIADLLKYVGVSDDKCDDYGRWLSDTWVGAACTWFNRHKKRKVKVRIDAYDTWNMDHTLAYIVLPMLKQLQKTKHGSPFVDDDDVPDELKSTSAPPVKDWESDDNLHARWDYVLNYLIWTFEQYNTDWESQYHTGEIDINWVEIDPTETDDSKKLFEMKKGAKDTHQFDIVGYRAHQEKIQKGLILFGKYFSALWD
jgi:hypothetical protein